MFQQAYVYYKAYAICNSIQTVHVTHCQIYITYSDMLGRNIEIYSTFRPITVVVTGLKSHTVTHFNSIKSINFVTKR